MDRHGYCTRQAYYPKQEPIQTKEQFCTWQWKNVFFFTNTDNTRNHKNWIKKHLKRYLFGLTFDHC